MGEDREGRRYQSRVGHFALKRRCYASLIGFMAAMTAGSAVAQQKAYPAQPLRVIVPYGAGGADDAIARVIGQALGERVGQTVVVDNRVGGSGMIGMELAARAAPNGYTLILGSSTTHAIHPVVYEKLPYDPVRDFEPIALVGSFTYILGVHSSMTAHTLKEFVALVKSQPGKLNYGSSGNATTTHLAMAALVSAAGLDMVHVPFKGGAAAAVTAVLSGEIQAFFFGVPAILPHVKAGRIRALANSSPQRSSALPDVPTVAESGYPGFDVAVWLGYFAPKGTPRANVNRLETELNAIMKTPRVQEQLVRIGAVPLSSTSAELAKLVRTDIERFRKITQAAGITAQ